MRTLVGELWGYHDPRTHVGFDLLVALLHSFRVPVFFLLAGFFAALLHQQRGPRRMLQNRLQRLLVPLIAGWVILFPATVAGVAFARLGGTAESAAAALRYVADSDALQYLQLLHLWFLLDLLFYCAVAVLLARLMASRVSEACQRPGRLDWLVAAWHARLVLALLTLVTLVPMPSGMLETPGSFSRPLATLAADGVFFGFGWLLHARRELRPRLIPRAGSRTLAACAVFPLHALALLRLADRPGPVVHLAAIASLSVTIWLFVFGLIGLSARYLAASGPARRYLADASYRFYLVHLPLVAWGTGLLAGHPWPAGVKYLVLLGGVVTICWVTYDVLMRPSVIGAVLNGRRYPRGLPVSPSRNAADGLLAAAASAAVQQV